MSTKQCTGFSVADQERVLTFRLSDSGERGAQLTNKMVRVHPPRSTRHSNQRWLLLFLHNNVDERVFLNGFGKCLFLARFSSFRGSSSAFPIFSSKYGVSTSLALLRLTKLSARLCVPRTYSTLLPCSCFTFAGSSTVRKSLRIARAIHLQSGISSPFYLI